LTEEAVVAHEAIILAMLEEHAAYANSSKARNLLANWATERQHFYVALPLWLNKTQTAEHLLAAMDRKEMVEELAVELAQVQIAQVRTAYQTAQPLFGGAIPQQTAQLINSFAVFDKAEQLAREMYRNSNLGLDSTQIEQAARKLILERPRKLQEALVKNTREAYSYYTDEQLACLLASKRLMTTKPR